MTVHKLILRFYFALFFMGCISCYSMEDEELNKTISKIFGYNVNIASETKKISNEQLEIIKSKLGGALVFKANDLGMLDNVQELTLHFFIINSIIDNTNMGKAIVLKEPGKWGMIEFLIAFDNYGDIKTVIVLQSQEKMGVYITYKSFLKQFQKKNLSTPMEIRKEIYCQSGATVSGRCAIFAVKKALLFYEACY